MPKIIIVVKQIRRARKLSIKELSEISGVKMSKILRIETGAESPKISIMLKLSQALNVDLESTFIVLKD